MDTEAMADDVIFGAVRDLVRRKHGEDRDVGADSDLFDDLELDSLDVAELSARLEEQLGTDPYTEGDSPRTIREVLAFYSASAG